MVTTATSIFDPNLASAQNGYNKYAFYLNFTDNAISPASAMSPQSCTKRAKEWLEYCGGKNNSLRTTGEYASAHYVRNNTSVLLGNYTYSGPTYLYTINDKGGWELIK